ncbi:ADP-ribosylation factor GTPase-activating protein 1, partial [Trichostrongylus colubriformis]
MRVGGNQKFRQFLMSQPDYREDWSLHDKYNSRAAALFRDKISTEAEGREWSAATSSARNYVPSTLNTGNRSGGDISRHASGTSLGSYYGGNSAAYSDGGAYSGGGGVQSDDRYRGFGNTVDSANNQDDLLSGAMSSLSVGWNLISKGASHAAAIAKDVSIQATQKASELSSQNSGLLSGVASKATEIGQKSWGGISQFVKSPSLQGLGNILPKKGYEDMASPTDESSNASFDGKSNYDSGGFSAFEKPSGQAGNAFFSLAGNSCRLFDHILLSLSLSQQALLLIRVATKQLSDCIAFLESVSHRLKSRAFLSQHILIRKCLHLTVFWLSFCSQ